MQMLKDKQCLVLGAAGGIGQHVTLTMAAAGCNLTLTDQSGKALDDVVRLVKESQEVEVDCVACDLNKQTALELTVDVIGRLAPPDIIINCAGVFDPDNEDYDLFMNVNLRAAWMFAEVFLPGMVRHGYGVMVNIGSSSAYEGYPNTPLYCASKHALLGLSRALHKKYAGTGVRVICISPDAVDTPMGARIPGQDPSKFLSPAYVADAVRNIICNSGMELPEVRLRRSRG